MSYFELKSPLHMDSAKYAGKQLPSDGRSKFSQRSILGYDTQVSLMMVLADFLALTIGFAIYYLAFGSLKESNALLDIFYNPLTSNYAHLLALLAGLNTIVFAYGGLYQRSSWDLKEFQRVVGGVGVTAVICLAWSANLAVGALPYSLVLAFVLVAVLTITFRMCLRGLPGIMRKMGSHVIIVGGHEGADLLVRQSESSRSNPIFRLAWLSFDELAVKDPKHLDEIVRDMAEQFGLPTDEVQILLAPTPEETAAAATLMARLDGSGHRVCVLQPMEDGLSRKGLRVQQTVGADMIVTETRPVSTSRPMQVIKRLMDVTAGLLAVVFFAPLLAFITIALFFEKGPIFYVQKRVGYRGRRFGCLKFRSMRPDAQEVLEEVLANDPEARAEWDRYQKLTNDPRVTWIGNILRKTSLDELPQLFNVLRGDMSLVGPRPIIAPEIPGYKGDRAYYEDPSFLYYASCKPGITGLWQVSGRASTVHDERVRLDRWYARNNSIWLDLCILFSTVRVVINGKGGG